MAKNHVQVSLKAVFDFNSWVYMDKISKKGMDQHMKNSCKEQESCFLYLLLPSWCTLQAPGRV